MIKIMFCWEGKSSTCHELEVRREEEETNQPTHVQNVQSKFTEHNVQT